jgi:LmbE family N-acetylglucosaminyl deacetylase
MVGIFIPVVEGARILLEIAWSRLYTRARGPAEKLVYSDLVVSHVNDRNPPSKIMIVAHPDDESLFGGEALVSAKGWMVVCATNASNPTRRREFINAMKSVGASYVMLNHADHLCSGNFDPALDQTLARLLNDRPYELIVTHGKRGEYGHPQHRALHEIVCRIAPRKLIRVFATNWWAPPRVSAGKHQLLSFYRSQPSICRYRFMAERESLRWLQ